MPYVFAVCQETIAFMPLKFQSDYETHESAVAILACYLMIACVINEYEFFLLIKYFISMKMAFTLRY